MNFRDQTLFTALAVLALTVGQGHSYAATRAAASPACTDGASCPMDASSSSSSSSVCTTACSAPQMRSSSSSVSKSLESAPADATALSRAAQTNDMDQVRSLLLKHGFTEEQLSFHQIEVRSVVSPRDAASGLPTGKRQHKPMVITKELDKSSPVLARDGGTVATGDVDGDGADARKIKVTITVSIKPPKLIITIQF
jgi:Type VI secretion system effector, Hcp